MQIVNKPYTNITLRYDLAAVAPLEDILFVDIETTGFSSDTSSVYLIGCAFHEDGIFTCRQFFSEGSYDEVKILTEFMAFAKDYKTLIHFNGNNFDIPFLKDRCKKLDVEFTLDGLNGIDIYRRTAPYKELLGVPNCKQKTLEQFMGISREDKYSGGELINVYLEYVKHFSVEGLTTLLLHNEDDVKGMIELTSILAYSDLFSGKLKVSKVNMNRYNDMNGTAKTELVMKLVPDSPLPAPISIIRSDYYLTAGGSEGILKVPVFDGELRYFYANYKDYYYLPEEDQAMHKSVASFVDRDHRKQATAATCYTRITSKFLPMFGMIAEPFFKQDYNSKQYFLEITDERKRDRQFFAEYAGHVIGALVSAK